MKKLILTAILIVGIVTIFAGCNKEAAMTPNNDRNLRNERVTPGEDRSIVENAPYVIPNDEPGQTQRRPVKKTPLTRADNLNTPIDESVVGNAAAELPEGILEAIKGTASSSNLFSQVKTAHEAVSA